MQKYSGTNIRTRIGQLWTSFGSASKYFKSVLSLVILVGSVSGGMISMKVEAVGVQGWRITYKETRANHADYCGDDRSGNLSYIELGKDVGVFEDKDQTMAKCVYASLGNNGGNEAIIGAFTNCELVYGYQLAGEKNRELFCTGEATRFKAGFEPRDNTIKPLSQIDKSQISGSKMPISHIKLSRSECNVEPNVSGTKIDCKIQEAQKTTGYTCNLYVGLEFLYCDNSNTAKTEDGKDHILIYGKYKNEDVTCDVELIKAEDAGATGYVPDKIIACESGKARKEATLTDDPNITKNCIAIRNSKTGTGLNGDILCRNDTDKINFSDNTDYPYIKGPYNSLFIFKSPDNKVQTLDEINLKKICKNDGVVEKDIAATDGAGTESATGKLICTAITQAQFFKTVDDEAKKGTEGVTSGKVNTGAASPKIVASNNGVTPDSNIAKGALGGLFSILYKVVLVILLIVLILIEYIQMIILTIMAYIISALLDLSPSAPILTSIGLPLWQIFANLANFLVIGFMVYVGAATMIGLMKTEAAGQNLVKISVLALLLNTTYFFLNFVISTVDGFAKLLVAVFVGNGGLFGLFTGMFGLFSRVSVLRDGKGAIDVSSPIAGAGDLFNTVGTAIGTATKQFSANDNGAALTFTFLGEALVVISFFIILLIFKDTFVLVFARVTILLLLLITSPVWVVAFFLKDIFKSSQISASLSKLPSQLFGTIVFNFAMVLGVIITVLITGKAQEGFKGYILDVGNAGGVVNNTGANSANFLSPNGASLIIAGVVPVFLGVAVLYFINQAFKNLFPLLDQIGTAVGNGATDFAKGIISGDVKGGITKFAKGATTLATGGGQLENIATMAPKLAVKGGVMGLGGLAGIGDLATGGKLGLSQKLANVEDRFIKPTIYNPTENLAGYFGDRIGENSNENKNARSITEQLRKQKMETRDQRNRRTVAEYMDEHNTADGFLGGRRGLVSGANEKARADTTEKRLNANKKTIELEGREAYLNSGSGQRDMLAVTELEQLANDREGRANATQSSVEERGKENYYNSTQGQDALKSRNLAENQLEQLKTIADNLKSGQESNNKADFYNDRNNRGLLRKATQSTIETELSKEIDQAQIDTKKANVEATVYRANRTSLTDTYNQLGDLKYSSGGLSDAQDILKRQKTKVVGAYQTKLNEESYAKQRKEEDDKKKQREETLVLGRTAQAGVASGVITTPTDKQKRNIKDYEDAVKNWKQTEFGLLKQRQEILFPPNGAVVDPSMVTYINDAINEHNADHPRLIP